VKAASLLLPMLAVLLSGCWVVLSNSDDVALYQSDDQRLIVSNTTTKTLTILGKPATPPIVIGPGGSVVVPFRVMTVGTLHAPSGTPYWTVGPGGYRETFVELQSPAIVDVSSPALTLHFHDASGAPVTGSFALNLCAAGAGWARSAVPKSDHQILLPDPTPAVPQAVCP
jgi:hypothetical protein